MLDVLLDAVLDSLKTLPADSSSPHTATGALLQNEESAAAAQGSGFL